MTSHVDRLRHRAGRRAAELARRREDPRFRSVMGRLVALGLLVTNIPGVVPHRRKIRIADACWAGEVEPRVLELLPALVLKKPGVFRDAARLPEDLRTVLAEARRGRCATAFRGIPGADYERWIPRIGHRGKRPGAVKTFRMTHDELARLDILRRRLGLPTDVDVVRAALRALEAACESGDLADGRAGRAARRGA